MKFSRLNRAIHKWASLAIALPILLIIITGALLLIKKEFAILQPETQRGVSQQPKISFEKILTQARSVKHANIEHWHDIDRLDVRPSKGVIKVRAKSSWEIQIDSETGKILQVAYRNSDLIESLHDGTFFEKNANLWLMLPVSIVLFFLWFTGLYLFCLPYVKRWYRRQGYE